MNCFQLSIFEISNTAPFTPLVLKPCCELLSIKYLWNIKYSSLFFFCKLILVVNCFHYSIFEISNTAVLSGSILLPSCELLSIKYLWNIKYSAEVQAQIGKLVVNCFQLSIFEISNTAYSQILKSESMLWIAFN